MSKNLTLEDMENIAFYESGLSAHGCLDNFDNYAIESITRYGRLLLEMQKENEQQTNLRTSGNSGGKTL